MKKILCVLIVVSVTIFVAAGNVRAADFTETPKEKVYTDKNYIKQGSGETITVNYETPQAGRLEITILNLNGQKLRYFAKDYDAKRNDYWVWDGINQDGKIQGKGIYFIVVKMGNWQCFKKVVILK